MTVWMWLSFAFGCLVVTAAVLTAITVSVGWVAARLWGQPTDNRAHKRA